MWFLKWGCVTCIEGLQTNAGILVSFTIKIHSGDIVLFSKENYLSGNFKVNTDFQNQIIPY
jgi:hypothetical protein